MQFRLIAGQHIDQDGVVYDVGDVVESDDDLVVLHPNKFVKVGEEEANKVAVDELAKPLGPDARYRKQDKEAAEAKEAAKSEETKAKEAGEVVDDDKVTQVPHPVKDVVESPRDVLKESKDDKNVVKDVKDEGDKVGKDVKGEKATQTKPFSKK